MVAVRSMAGTVHAPWGPRPLPYQPPGTRVMSRYHARTVLITLTALLATAACARDDADTTADTAAAVTAGDTVMASGPRRGPARDADHEFLRMMSDHHQGLVLMATGAMNRGTTPEVRDDAHAIGTKQDREMREMIEMIQGAYGESIDAVAMSSHRAMNDSLQAMSGPQYDRTFYRMVVQHHREGIRMMDDFQSRVQRAEVRQMIDRMRADQQREIQELERKAAGRG
jgi:uncharacterized protein (DUF305 family)